MYRLGICSTLHNNAHAYFEQRAALSSKAPSFVFVHRTIINGTLLNNARCAEMREPPSNDTCAWPSSFGWAYSVFWGPLFCWQVDEKSHIIIIPPFVGRTCWRCLYLLDTLGIYANSECVGVCIGCLWDSGLGK